MPPNQPTPAEGLTVVPGFGFVTPEGAIVSIAHVSSVAPLDQAPETHTVISLANGDLIGTECPIALISAALSPRSVVTGLLTYEINALKACVNESRAKYAGVTIPFAQEQTLKNAERALAKLREASRA